MSLQIRKLKDNDFDDLYLLLKQLEFPYLPSSKQQAYNVLKLSHNHLYGGFTNNKIVLFMCFSENNSKLYFDIACKNNYQKKWANKKVIRFIFDKAFNKLGYDEFYTESYSQVSQKAVEKLGFSKLTGFYYVLKVNSNTVQKYLRRNINETNK